MWSVQNTDAVALRKVSWSEADILLRPLHLALGVEDIQRIVENVDIIANVGMCDSLLSDSSVA